MNDRFAFARLFGAWLLFCVACTDPAQPAPVPLTPAARIAVAVDSLNAAIRDLYAEGGEVQAVQLLQPDSYPPDSTIPPVVVVLTGGQR